jgi:hypothetical protein
LERYAKVIEAIGTTTHGMLDMALGLRWMGSFQASGNHLGSENSLEEVWAQFGKMGTTAHLDKLKPDNPTVPWPKHIGYARVRIHQAMEFRAAAHAATLLTAPLPLYYAFLNLMRAQIALIPEVLPKNAHGLTFHAGADLLTSTAGLQAGTFTDYLNAQKITWKQGQQITLRDALGCVFEMYSETFDFDRSMVHSQQVIIDAVNQGPIWLFFPNYPRDLATSWAMDFPTLVGHCDVADKSRLLVKPPSSGKTYESISAFFHQTLLNNLIPLNRPCWWMFLRSEPHLQLDRISYYHVAAFILGSAVRYNPELVLAVNAPDSGVGWLIKRFLKRAERFYPQLQFMYGAGGREVYF